MESMSNIEIATAIGMPTSGLLGPQQWCPPLHPGVLVDEIHYRDNGGVFAFRITDTIAGTVISKIPEENAPGDVDGVYDAMMAVYRHIALTVTPAIYEAVPDLDPEAQIVRGLTIGGKGMISDLVNGQIQNLRPPAVMPDFSLDKAGKLQIDVSKLVPAHQLAVKNAVAKIAVASSAIGATVLDAG